MAALATALARPGNDPRQWVSIGLVSEEQIDFDVDHGPLIPVILKPSEIEIQCRVAMQVGGNGEGEYYPFVEGDEVIVLIPGGNERGGCCIVGRLPNQRTPFPQSSVAGQDPATNSFGFRRTKAPFITEAAGPLTMRQAESGAFFSLDQAGTATLSNGEKSALQLSADALTLQSGDGGSLLQLDITGGRATLQSGGAVLTLASSTAIPSTSSIVVPSVLQFSTAGAPPAEHVITTEQVVNLVSGIFNTLGVALTALGATPLTGAVLGALLEDPTFSTALAVAIPLLAQRAQNNGVALSLVAAFANPTAKPAPVPGQGQLQPGIGCTGLLAG
jgi:hypothetical protein